MVALLLVAGWLVTPTGATFNDTSSNGPNDLTAVECFACDVEVVDLDAPSTIILSFTYNVDVTVRNNGTGSVPATVTLRDTTNDILIGSQSITLAAGETRVLSYTWEPDNFIVEFLVLRAEATSPRDPDASNNWKEETVLVVL